MYAYSIYSPGLPVRGGGIGRAHDLTLSGMPPGRPWTYPTYGIPPIHLPPPLEPGHASRSPKHSLSGLARRAVAAAWSRASTISPLVNIITTYTAGRPSRTVTRCPGAEDLARPPGDWVMATKHKVGSQPTSQPEPSPLDDPTAPPCGHVGLVNCLTSACGLDMPPFLPSIAAVVLFHPRPCLPSHLPFFHRGRLREAQEPGWLDPTNLSPPGARSHALGRGDDGRKHAYARSKLLVPPHSLSLSLSLSLAAMLGP